MASDGSYIIDTKINSSGLNKDLKKMSKEFDDISDAAKDSRKDVERSFDKMGDAAKETGRQIEESFNTSFDEIAKANFLSDFSLGALEQVGDILLDVASDSIEAAAEIRAANAQFEQTFRGVEQTARESLNNISEATGIAATRLQDSYTSIFAFAKTVGSDTADALDISSRAMIVAADSAAYYDRSVEEVTESLQSFLKGNYENDAALGIAATETTRNAKANELYAKSFDRLTESQKVDVLLAMVEAGNELSGALGQAAREADAWANVTGEFSEAWKQFLAVSGETALDKLAPVLKFITEDLNKYVELRNKLRDDNPLADEMSEIEIAAQSTATTVQQLRSEYEQATEAARKSLDAQIGLFEALVTESDTGAAQIIENWQSQREAFAQYTENLKNAVNMGLDQALVQQLSDGSAQSMSILHALVNDTDISIDDINAAFQGVSEARDTVSAVMADVQTDMSNKLDELSGTVASEWGEMSGIVGAEIANMQAYIDSLIGKTVYVDVVTRSIGAGTQTGYANNSSTRMAEASVTPFAVPTNIPYLASGAVIPPNAPFYAVLGDQKHGTNIEAPLATIQEAVRAEIGDQLFTTNELLRQILEKDIDITLDGRSIAENTHTHLRRMARAGGW